MRSSRGELVPIGAAARLVPGLGPLGVSHSGQLPAVTLSFDVKPGTPALQPFEGLNIGLLPDCGTPIPNTSPPRVADPPCVFDRQSVGGGATIVVRAPGGDQDPRFGP